MPDFENEEIRKKLAEQGHSLLRQYDLDFVYICGITKQGKPVQVLSMTPAVSDGFASSFVQSVTEFLLRTSKPETPKIIS